MSALEAIWLAVSVAGMLAVPIYIVRATLRDERAVRQWSSRGGWRHGSMPGESPSTFNGSDPL